MHHLGLAESPAEVDLAAVHDAVEVAEAVGALELDAELCQLVDKSFELRLLRLELGLRLGKLLGVRVARRAAVTASVSVLEQAVAHYSGSVADELRTALERQRDRLTRVNRYVDAYRHYCWPVNSVNDLKLAPFHMLASEGGVHVDKDHLWHMQTLARLTENLPETPLLTTAYRIVDVTVPCEVEGGIAWWEQLTGGGGEGMVVKPLDFVVRGKKGLVQPAVKCRGPVRVPWPVSSFNVLSSACCRRPRNVPLLK